MAGWPGEAAPSSAPFSLSSLERPCSTSLGPLFHSHQARRPELATTPKTRNVLLDEDTRRSSACLLASPSRALMRCGAVPLAAARLFLIYSKHREHISCRPHYIRHFFPSPAHAVRNRSTHTRYTTLRPATQARTLAGGEWAAPDTRH